VSGPAGPRPALQPRQIDFLVDLNPDCSLAGIPTARTVEEPGHGKLTIRMWSAIGVFLRDRPRRACHCLWVLSAVVPLVR
jgi:hypothetical protein